MYACTCIYNEELSAFTSKESVSVTLRTNFCAQKIKRINRMLGSTRKGIERKKKTMLLHHCVNLNIAKDSGHLFEDDGQEIGKAKKGYQAESELQNL